MQVLDTLFWGTKKLTLSLFSPSYHHKPFYFYLYSSQKNIGICTYSNLLHIRRTRTKGVWCQTCFLIMTSPVCKKEDFHWVTTWILVCYSHKAISWNFQGQHFQGHCSFKKYNMCSANQNKASIFHQLAISKCATVCGMPSETGTTSTSVTWDG